MLFPLPLFSSTFFDTRFFLKHGRTQVRLFWYCEAKVSQLKIVILISPLSIEFFITRKFLKHIRVFPYDVFRHWERKKIRHEIVMPNPPPPPFSLSLSLSLFLSQLFINTWKFLKHRRVSLRNFLVLSEKISDRISWYCLPSYARKFAILGCFWNNEGLS